MAGDIAILAALNIYLVHVMIDDVHVVTNCIVYMAESYAHATCTMFVVAFLLTFNRGRV